MLTRLIYYSENHLGTVDGKMIDEPVYQRAKALLAKVAK